MPAAAFRATRAARVMPVGRSLHGVLGKAYVIEWTPNLSTPFSTVRTVTATATTSTETVTSAGTMGFYRVRPQ